MDDSISRQTAIKTFYEATGDGDKAEWCAYVIKSIPAAQPKMGRWVAREVVTSGKSIEDWQTARCSVCGFYHITPYLHYFDNFKYCPECGAKMEGTE